MRTVENKSPYYLWVDVVRVIAIFFVVWLHVAAKVVGQFNKIDIADWWIANAIDSALRVGVPIFFMLTGHLLLHKEETLPDYFKKRFSRILIPWLVWSVIYLGWAVYFHHEDISFLGGIEAILGDKVFSHFWFLYALMALYLFIPVLRVFFRHCNNSHIKYFLWVWFLAVACIPVLEKTIEFLFHREMHVAIDLNMMSGYTGYLILGYYLGQLKISKTILWKAGMVYVVGALATAFLTFLYSSHSYTFEEYFYSYLSPNVIVMSIAAFIVLKYLGETIEWGNFQSKILKDLSLATFGIYLLHPMILDFLNHGNAGGEVWPIHHGNSFYLIPFKAMIIYMVSFLVVKCLRSMPVLNKIV